MRYLHFTFSFCILIFAFCIGNIAYAAELFFEPKSQELGVGQEFQVNLMLDPEGKEINTVAVRLSFPKDLLEVVEVNDGNSILTLWVERPQVKIQDKRNEIQFAGIIPGGFIGILGPYEEPKPGELLEIIMRTKDAGQGEIIIEEAQVLLNDGLGTPTEFQASNSKLQVSEDREVVPRETIPDIIPPEPFTPEITRYPDMFEGKYFLVFSTTDKQSGIDHYEVCEDLGFRIQNLGRVIKKILYPKSYILDFCSRAESPYVLKDQGLRSYIYVKAVDKAGNEKIETVEAQHPLKWYENYLAWVILLIALAVIYYIIRKFRRNLKFKK